MQKIFLDTDVILDVLAKRMPYYLHSAELLSEVEKNHIAAFTSPIVFANLYYILRKLKTKEYALQSLRKLRIIVQIVSVNEQHIDKALNSEFTDFEDAIQHYSAQTAQIDYLITRNVKDYKSGFISVCTPEAYLSILKSGTQ